MFKFLVIFLVALTCNATSIKNQTYNNVIVDEVTSIYDGDTFRANIKGYPDIIGKRIGIRVNGIDTPEMRGKCDKEKKLAHEAKQFAVAMLRSGKVIEFRNLKRGKYFRIVADVFVDGESLGEELIDNKLAMPYDGGTKVKDWCE